VRIQPEPPAGLGLPPNALPLRSTPAVDRLLEDLEAAYRDAERHVQQLTVAAAVAILCFVAGYGAAKWSGGREAILTPAGPQFMLLLHDTDALKSHGIPENRLVEEYGQWARAVKANGRAIRGEKLRDVPGQTLSGFFIVAAPSLDEARAIAASCPHVQYGGLIEIREINPI